MLLVFVVSLVLVSSHLLASLAGSALTWSKTNLVALAASSDVTFDFDTVTPVLSAGEERALCCLEQENYSFCRFSPWFWR